MIIGRFRETNEGYVGEVITLTFRQMLIFERTRRGGDYLVTMAGEEVGAAWKGTAQETGKAYLRVRLDCPFLPAPIGCALMPQDDGMHILVWERDHHIQE